MVGGGWPGPLGDSGDGRMDGSDMETCLGGRIDRTGQWAGCAGEGGRQGVEKTLEGMLEVFSLP